MTFLFFTALNRYAIDRNYGVVFVIWDRLHGTFAQEMEDEKLYFGSLTHFPTHDLIKLQVRVLEFFFFKTKHFVECK